MHLQKTRLRRSLVEYGIALGAGYGAYRLGKYLKNKFSNKENEENKKLDE